ncbi:MAG: Type 1 glutamine amidotransferase-like domain-containing protein [Patescibacteria group bacterium]
MAIKYILHGGYAGHTNSQNDEFYKEILKDTPDKLKVLLVYFAKEDDRITVNKEEDVAHFENNMGNKVITFEVATEKDFSEQVRQANIIHLHGGATLKLLAALKKHSDLKGLFGGKVVAGESAGAYVLSAYFYSKTAGGLFPGLGLVPAKTICHYIGENKEKLDEAPNNFETLLLKDYEYKIFNL